MSDKPYRLFGMTQSYFTRKLSAYLDHKGIPYLFRRFAGGQHFRDPLLLATERLQPCREVDPSGDDVRRRGGFVFHDDFLPAAAMIVGAIERL